MSVMDGYTMVEVDGKQFLIPNFAVDHFKMRMIERQKYQEMDGSNITDPPRKLTENSPSPKLGKESVRAIPDPGLSRREWLSLHSEVKAMQDTYGLSYKDAAHRIYLAEQARLEALTDAHRSVSFLRERVDKILDHEILPVVANLEEHLEDREKEKASELMKNISE